METGLLIAVLVTLGAGLSTGFGAGLALFAKATNDRFLASALGFSAGVMLYVSFVEILPKAMGFLGGVGTTPGLIEGSAAFLGGLLLMALLYRFLPNLPMPRAEERKLPSGQPELDLHEPRARLFKAGMLIALAITIHNFPEGIATFFLTLDDPAVGMSVGTAIAIHNIPEGIAVAIPLYYALHRRGWAFGLGVASGLAEPLGALLGYWILQPFISDSLLGILFAAVAGIMVYISIDSLLPAAREFASGQVAIYGVIAGMAVMALSLVLYRMS
jgi:ZIP family zinc transporter